MKAISENYFKCPHCPKSFLSDSYLQSHIARRHSKSASETSRSSNNPKRSTKPDQKDGPPGTEAWKEEINELKNMILDKLGNNKIKDDQMEVKVESSEKANIRK